MTISITPSIFPSMPKPKFYIGQHEPLTWLVSILFTNEFWQRDNLTSAKLGLYSSGNNIDIEKPKYSSWSALYEAIENWIKGDEAATACLTRAKQAIQHGDLAYYSPEANEWGDKPYHEPNRDIDSYQFLLWAEKNGTQISKDVIDASRIAIQMAQSRKAYEEQQASAYPLITADDFARLRKQPLWEINTGLLYLMGRRSKVAGKEMSYKGDNKLFDELADYVVDAQRSQQLQLIQETESSTMKVVPSHLIEWAQTLPVTLPMLNSPLDLRGRTTHSTPDMELMFDAIERFWKNYDLTNPNPGVAPIKKEVMKWLILEAKKRGITDFSETRAKNIDTIIRCPKARLGGNSL